MHRAPSKPQRYLRGCSHLSSFVRKAVVGNHVSCQTRKTQLHLFFLTRHTCCRTGSNCFETLQQCLWGEIPHPYPAWQLPYFDICEFLPFHWNGCHYLGVLWSAVSINLINKGRCLIVLPNEKSKT